MSPDPDAPVVLITGATGPLGRAVAPRFARDGARLALVGRDHGRLAELGEGLGVASDLWMPVPGDLTVAGSAGAVADAVTAQWGRIDILLHLVGGWAGGTAVVDLDHDEVRRMLDQHLWTTLHVAQAVVPGMVERGFGRVIAVSSPLAAEPGPKGASYAIAKAAEEALVRSLAREVSGSGVTANLVLVRTLDAMHERETAPTPKNAVLGDAGGGRRDDGVPRVAGRGCGQRCADPAVRAQLTEARSFGQWSMNGMSSPGIVTNGRIMSRSSCSRMWQWYMNRPAKSSKRTTMSTISFGLTRTVSLRPSSLSSRAWRTLSSGAAPIVTVALASVAVTSPVAGRSGTCRAPTDPAR